jgi:hypothetical protein
MKTPNTKLTCDRCWLWPALAILLAFAIPNVSSQGIVYGRFPPFSPAYFSYDYEGTRVAAATGYPAQLYELQIDGHTAYTFYSWNNFSIIPSSSNAVLAGSAGIFAVALGYGQEIGSDAQGHTWAVTGGSASFGSLLHATRSSDTIGEEPSTFGNFTGLESAYIGLQFQQDGQTYYGWARAGAPFIGINGGWIYDYAYETTPNKPIAAGAGVPPTNRFSATFNGGNEVPANRSTNSGTGTFTLNGSTLTYLLKFDYGFRPKAAKVFRPGRSLVADLGDYLLVNWPQIALYHGEITLNSKQIRELWAGRLNVNFPSTNFPHGELRGPILPVDGNQNGVPDYLDSYVEQVSPCDGPWKNHGQYVRAVTRALLELAAAKPISGPQFRRIVRDAQRSDCGKIP